MVATIEKPDGRRPAAKVQSTIRFDPEQYDAVSRAARAAGLAVNTWLVRVVAKELLRLGN